MKIILYLIVGLGVSLVAMLPLIKILPYGESLNPIFFYFVGAGICGLYHHLEK